MRARLALVLATSLGIAACQGDDANPSVSSTMRPGNAQENLLTLVPEQGLSSVQQGRLENVRRRAGDDVHLARIAPGAANLMRQGNSLRVAVEPGMQVVALGERVQRRAENDISWAGPVEGTKDGWVQMVLAEEGVMATVTMGTAQWTIEPLGNGLHAVSKLDQRKMPPEHTPDNPAGVLDTPPPADFLASAMAAQGDVGIAALSTINVLVVYTASAASAAGNIASRIQLAVDETNQSYVNSGININMVRVHTAQVTYNETGTFSQHVSRLRSTTDGYMDNVHTLRNTYAADVVVLVVNDSEACGIASSIGSTASSAFAVAHWSCITGYYSFGHEVGHLQGARHDRFVDASTTPYAYGHGFIPSTKTWRTVMAYGNNCSNCTRIQWWSNPLKTYPSTGQVMGTVQYEDNARVLNLTAASIAAYR